MSLTTDLREMGAEILSSRELLFEMTKRDLLLRYKQTVMGFAWAVFMPLLNTAVFSVIFMRVAQIDVGAPYPLFAFCGLLVWNFFASTQKFALTSLTSNTNLVTKVYFPREVFPVSAALVCLVDFAVASLVLIALMIYYQTPVTGALVFLPLVIVVHLMFTIGVALFVSMANLFYRDVKYIFDIVLTVGMFATSVLYPADLVKGTLATVMRLNPMTPIIDAYRDVLIFGRFPQTTPFLIAVGFSALTLFLGWLLFHRAEFEFAENV